MGINLNIEGVIAKCGDCPVDHMGPQGRGCGKVPWDECPMQDIDKEAIRRVLRGEGHLMPPVPEAVARKIWGEHAALAKGE